MSDVPIHIRNVTDLTQVAMLITTGLCVLVATRMIVATIKNKRAKKSVIRPSLCIIAFFALSVAIGINAIVRNSQIIDENEHAYTVALAQHYPSVTSIADMNGDGWFMGTLSGTNNSPSSKIPCQFTPSDPNRISRYVLTCGTNNRQIVKPDQKA